MHEAKDMVGGACKTEYAFRRAPNLGTSTGEASFPAALLEVVRSETVNTALQELICWE